MNKELQSAYRIVEIGQGKERQSEPGRAFACYQSALETFMAQSLVDSGTAEAVSAWLAEHPFALAAERYFATADALLADSPAQWIESFRSDHYNLFAFAHFFALLGQHERAGFLTRNAFQSTRRSTPFWMEYQKAMRAMLAREAVEPAFSKLGGLEAHWRHYVDLMGAVQQGGDRDAVLARIDQSFAARNRDNRLNGIAQLDGSGHMPLAFDFRKAGLLATIAHAGL